LSWIITIYHEHLTSLSPNLTVTVTGVTVTGASPCVIVPKQLISWGKTPTNYCSYSANSSKCCNLCSVQNIEPHFISLDKFSCFYNIV